MDFLQSQKIQNTDQQVWDLRDDFVSPPFESVAMLVFTRCLVVAL
jgi:hypothetical protein